VVIYFAGKSCLSVDYRQRLTYLRSLLLVCLPFQLKLELTLNAASLGLTSPTCLPWALAPAQKAPPSLVAPLSPATSSSSVLHIDQIYLTDSPCRSSSPFIKRLTRSQRAANRAPSRLQLARPSLVPVQLQALLCPSRSCKSFSLKVKEEQTPREELSNLQNLQGICSTLFPLISVSVIASCISSFLLFCCPAVLRGSTRELGPSC
jgi:hypothetical protein